MAFLPRSPKEKRRLFYILVILGYIALEIYLGAEYALKRDSNFRAFQWDSQVLWKLKKSYKGTAFGEDIHTNSAGFRGTQNYEQKSSHRYRIITLGDSRTYGFSVEDNQTFSAVLERSLREKGHDVEVINAGTHGYSALQCRARLQQLLSYDLISLFSPPDIMIGGTSRHVQPIQISPSKVLPEYAVFWIYYLGVMYFSGCFVRWENINYKT